jgi:hypothetical protein
MVRIHEAPAAEAPPGTTQQHSAAGWEHTWCDTAC